MPLSWLRAVGFHLPRARTLKPLNINEYEYLSTVVSELEYGGT